MFLFFDTETTGTPLFNKGFDGAHDALADVKACASCFFKLVELGSISLAKTAIHG